MQVRVEGTIDRIVGHVYTKDVFLNPTAPAMDLLKPVRFVPELITLTQLLDFFRGTKTEFAIVVDEHGCTSDPAIYAAGDCTRFPSRRYGRELRLECVQNAIDQAKAVAAAILGKPQAYDPVPWFWSDQYDLKLQMAGLSDGYDEARTIGDVAAARFSVEYRKGGRLIAVDAVNDGRAYMSCRKRIAEETAAAGS